MQMISSKGNSFLPREQLQLNCGRTILCSRRKMNPRPLSSRVSGDPVFVCRVLLHAGKGPATQALTFPSFGAIAHVGFA